MNKTTLLGFGSSLVNKSFISELLQVGLGARGMMMGARSQETYLDELCTPPMLQKGF